MTHPPTPTSAQLALDALHPREIDYLRTANRQCGMSYRSACRRSSGIETAKRLKGMGLLYLHDKGERCQQGRYIFRTTDAGKTALQQLIAREQ